MKPGDTVIEKDGNGQEMYVDSIVRGIVKCHWYKHPDPTPQDMWPSARRHEKEFYYHNLQKVKT